MRQVPEVALPIVLDRTTGGPLPNQIADSIRRLATAGVLRSGEAVPSSRALARHLGVSRGTVIVAYDQLLAEGWLVAVPGAATSINPQLPRSWISPPAVDAGSASQLEEPPRLDLRPGRPLQDEVAGPSWRAAWRVAAAAPVGVGVPPLGWLPLRAAVVEHLRRLRGFSCEPDRVAVTAGGREGLGLLLYASGAKDVGVEFVTLSKSYNMAGWRVGFCVGNPEIIAALTRIKSYLDYGIFQPIQIAAIIALNGPNDCVKEIRDVYRSRRDVLVDGLNRIGWEIEKPKATMFVWAKIPDQYLSMGSLEFSKMLIEKAKVAVSPGIGFGEGGDQFVRFALVENEFGEAAIDNLRRFIQAGGKVALGTDYEGYNSQFDLGMPIREIRWMKKAGMTPLQIIVAATKNASFVCNLANEIGTLEKGKIADVLIVRGDPLEDIEALLDPRMVIHNGQIIRDER